MLPVFHPISIASPANVLLHCSIEHMFDSVWKQIDKQAHSLCPQIYAFMECLKIKWATQQHIRSNDLAAAFAASFISISLPRA